MPFNVQLCCGGASAPESAGVAGYVLFLTLLDEAAKAAEGPIIVLSGKHTNVGVFITVERR